MNPFRRFLSIFRREPPAMIGVPPSRTPPSPPMPPARPRFLPPLRQADELSRRESHDEALGIPTTRWARFKYGHPHRAFWPEEATGGGNVPGGNPTVESSAFSTSNCSETLVPRYHPAGRRSLCGTASTRSSPTSMPRPAARTHDEAVAKAADTELPISDRARRLLREIAEAAEKKGWSR